MSFLDDISHGLGAIVNPIGTLSGLLPKGGDPGKKQLSQVLAILKQRELANRGVYANALQHQKSALGTIQKGTKNALATTSRIGASAKQGAVDRGTQTLAAGQQSLQDRGLGNTTAYQQLASEVGSGTSRALLQIDEAMAGLQSGIQLQGAQAEAGAQGGIANLLMGQSAQSTNLSSSIASTIAGVQHQDPNAWLSQLFQLGGSLGTAAILSDRRLKTDIVKVDEVDGINVYEFEYIAVPGQRHRGVIAQEVAHLAGVVHADERGYFTVDYSKLPARIKPRVVGQSAKVGE